MSDIQLFRINQQGKATAVEGSHSPLEKPLQQFIEMNLEELLAIRFIESEHSTGKTHAGRIDTLGLDENNCPVIIEYKRSSSENVINQGLYYLDWLMDHQAEFTLLVMNKLGKETAEAIDWSAPRLLCIAAGFTKYDSHAVLQINRNIELIRYKQFGEDLFLLELATSTTASSNGKTDKGTSYQSKDVTQWLSDLPGPTKEIFDELDNYLVSLGDDVSRKDLKLYAAYKRLRNFVTVVFQNKSLRVFLHLDPSEHPHEEGFTRDVTNIGHWGTGNLEITLTSLADLEKAKPYLQAAYTSH